MNLKIKLFTFFIASMVLLGACKKDVDETTNPVVDTEIVPTGNLTFHLHTYIEDNEVDAYGIEYTTAEGRIISLDIAQMYISDIQLVKLDGSIYTVPNKSILKVFETASLVIGDVPVGNYKSIRFKVGLNSTMNALDPTSTGDSIILNKPSMWFSTPVQPDGYVFMNVQGSIDTTVAMNGIPVPFSYKIGTNANYFQVEMPEQNFTVLENMTAYAHMIADYSKLFTGIQLNDFNNLSVNTVGDNSLPIATAIKNNIPLLFRYE